LSAAQNPDRNNCLGRYGFSSMGSSTRNRLSVWVFWVTKFLSPPNSNFRVERDVMTWEKFPFRFPTSLNIPVPLQGPILFGRASATLFNKFAVSQYEPTRLWHFLSHSLPIHPSTHPPTCLPCVRLLRSFPCCQEGPEARALSPCTLYGACATDADGVKSEMSCP
jgi:hypothetical protein